MEGPRFPPAFDAPINGPSSPPTTPGASAELPFVPVAAYSTSCHKRMNGYHLSHSPPLEHIEPTGYGHQFFYTRPQWHAFSSRTSSISGAAHARDDASAVAMEPQSEEPPPHQRYPARTVEDGDFVVEEVAESDVGYGSETEVVQPDGVEEATGAKDTRHQNGDDSGIARDFEQLNCNGPSVSSDEEQRRKWERRKKRWSGRPFKRTHSQSVGSDTDDADLEGLEPQEVGCCARRLRRRVGGPGGPGDRTSLIFEDLGSSFIHEEHEPDDTGSGSGNITRPPSVLSDQEGLHALPFWVLQDPMEIDSGSSTPSSMA